MSELIDRFLAKTDYHIYFIAHIKSDYETFGKIMKNIERDESSMMTPKVIAEVGCNHKGDMEIAKQLINIAAVYCKADVVKFQKRNNRELLSEEQYNAPHPNPANSYGNTYGEHREYLEFTLEQHRELKKYCEEFGVVYSTSVAN